MRYAYFETIMLIEKLHRLYLDVVKYELDKMGIEDITNVQAMILYNIGEGQVTIGELTNRGYYLGSNVSYNLKKMIAYGYVIQEPSPHDRRSSRVKLSPKGLDLREKISNVISEQVEELPALGITLTTLRETEATLIKLGDYWEKHSI
jgi:DNA-binding MarR family transcriptional regulator